MHSLVQWISVLISSQWWACCKQLPDGGINTLQPILGIIIPRKKKKNCHDLPPPIPPMVSSLDSKPGHEDHLKSRNAIPHTDWASFQWLSIIQYIYIYILSIIYRLPIRIYIWIIYDYMPDYIYIYHLYHLYKIYIVFCSLETQLRFRCRRLLQAFRFQHFIHRRVSKIISKGIAQGPGLGITT